MAGSSTECPQLRHHGQLLPLTTVAPAPHNKEVGATSGSKISRHRQRKPTPLLGEHHLKIRHV
jgi:hypothetical protein